MYVSKTTGFIDYIALAAIFLNQNREGENQGFGGKKMRTRKFITLVLPLLVLGLLGSLDAQSITVTKPVAGNHFCNWGDNPGPGIAWTKSGAMHAQVRIELFDSNGINKVMDIVASTPNNGNYYWDINSIPVAPPGSYVVKVTTLDNLVTGQSAVFVMEACNFPGALSFIAPANGAHLCKGSTYKIRWQVGNPPPYHYFYHNARLTLFPANQEPTGNYGNVGAPPLEQGEFDWTIPTSTPSGNYKLWLITVIGSNAAVVEFTIDNCIQPQPWWKELMKKISVIHWRTVDPKLSLKGSVELNLAELQTIMSQGKEKVRIELMKGRQVVADLGQFGPKAVVQSWFRVSLPVNKLSVRNNEYQLRLKNVHGKILCSQPVKLEKIGR